MAPPGHAAVRGALAVLPLEDLCRVRELARAWREEATYMQELPAFPLVTSARALKALPPLGQGFPRLAPGSLTLRLGDDYAQRDLERLEGACGRLLGDLSVLLVEGTSDEGLARAVRGCKRLRSLEVSDYDLVGGQHMQGQFLKEVPRCLESLAVRVLPAISDETFQCAMAAAPDLRVVECEGLDELTDAGIRTLASLPRLTKLRLGLTRLAPQPQISEETLLFILEGCIAHHGEDSPEAIGLEVLELAVPVGPPLHLSGGGAPFASALCKHTALQSLVLSGVSGLADAGLNALAQACPELKELVLYRPGQLFTGEGLLRCLSHLGHLERLTLGAVARFKDAFSAVCAACSERLLWLKMTRYFNSAGAADAAAVLQRLRTFHNLEAAVFSGTFSAEQACAAKSVVLSPGGLNFCEGISLQQLNDQTFQAQVPRSSGAPACTVIFERCLREQDVR